MKKSIAIIIQALRFGGAERCASNLSLDLEELYDTHLIVFDGQDRTYPFGGTLHDLKIPKASGIVSKVLITFKRILKVKRIKRKHNISCSISLLTGANFVNVHSQVHDKTIVSIRNNMSLSRLSDRENNMVRESCNKADLVVTLSESVRQDMIHNYGIPAEKVKTIYNSCDAERLQRLASITGNPLGLQDEYIVTMGRLMFQKGQWHLIKAFSKVLTKHPNLKLVILGEGEDDFADAVRAVAGRMGIENSVLFPGYIENPHQIIAGSKMFVFPSLYEGLGNVLLEALACGKAVISTDCLSGPREILAPDTDLSITEKRNLKGMSEEKYGILIPAFDQTDDMDENDLSENELILANAIIQLYEDDEKRKLYEKRSRERIMDFSPEKIVMEWGKAIEDVCQ